MPNSTCLESIQSSVARFVDEARRNGWDAKGAESVEAAVRPSNVVITSTPSRTPLIEVQWVQPGTHITAIGADTPDKQELDEALLGRADLVVVDSVSQSRSRGEVHHGLRRQTVREHDVVELGRILLGEHPGRREEQAITVADLTGIAVQDLAISTAVLEAYEAAHPGE